MRPYQRLPMPMPKDFDPGKDEPDFFYNNFAKHFIPDMIQMMDTGLHIDQDAVEELRSTVDNVLKDVEDKLSKSTLIKEFQKSILPAAQKAHAEKATQSVRELSHYIKPFKDTDVIHRTWVVNTYLDKIGHSKDKKDKWTLKDLKTLNIFLKDSFISALCDRRRLTNNSDVIAGMKKLAEYKLDLWNRPRYEKAKEPVKLDSFNPGSSKQVKEFFEFCKIPPKAFSKDTGEASWGRDQLEELFEETTDKDLLDVLQPMIDYSSSSIIKTNFIKAFDKFTVDGVLHGNIKLFGAKSFRNTSNSPNLLNAPSTGSIYAKPLKKCFVSPDNYVVYTADESALEDRVIANLSGDKNKQNIFLEGLDGHSLNACGYFQYKIEESLGPCTDITTFVKAFMGEVEAGNKLLKGIRQDSKAPTFKLAYGGYPDADKGGVITQGIFDNYHNVLYPGITDYRENYVLPFARTHGYIHLGLGCRIYTSDAGQDIRTLNNATVQFWSILTLIAINEFNYRIREEGLQDLVKVNSTIYDSIYTYTYRDPEIIKWVNDNLIEVMTVPYLENEVIHNEADGEIGLNWADLHKVKNGASVDDINLILKEL
jgi:hypothetical protein